MKTSIQGVFPAMLTPFTRHGAQVDYDRAAALAAYLADKGVDGLFPCGTTGEGLLMTLDERKKLLEVVLDAVGKRLKVIAHTGCLDLASTIELTRHAMEAGAKAAGVIAPGFYGYDAKSLHDYYVAVARAVKGFPVLLYNLPSCTGNTLTSDLVVSLSRAADNIVGIKDSGGDLLGLTTVINNARAGFAVINGVDSHTYYALLSGAHGSVASAANVVPELFIDIRRDFKQGKLDAAWRKQQTLNAVAKTLQYGRMVAFCKEAMRLRGFDPGFVRSPQRELNAAERKQLEKEMKNCKML